MECVIAFQRKMLLFYFILFYSCVVAVGQWWQSVGMINFCKGFFSSGIVNLNL